MKKASCRRRRVDHRCRRGDDFHNRGRVKPPTKGPLRKLRRTDHGSASRSKTQGLRCHSPWSHLHRGQPSENALGSVGRACQGEREGERQKACRPPEKDPPLRPARRVQRVLADEAWRQEMAQDPLLRGLRRRNKRLAPVTLLAVLLFAATSVAPSDAAAARHCLSIHSP